MQRKSGASITLLTVPTLHTSCPFPVLCSFVGPVNGHFLSRNFGIYKFIPVLVKVLIINEAR